MTIRVGWLVGLALALAAAACGGGDDTALETTTSVAQEAGSTDNAVAWVTDRVSLEADDFRILADGVEFLGSAGAELNSDGGDSSYTTLEVEWQERGVEMRLFMYFEAVGGVWHCYEMRIYDGHQDGDWIYFTGPFFESSLGEPFAGTALLESDPDNEDNEFSGQVQFANLRLLPAFKGQDGFDSITSTSAVTSVTEPVAPTDNPVAWNTEWVSLEADDFRLVADGIEFLGSGAIDLDYSSDDSSHTRLKAEWQENGVEMRLVMRFEAVGDVWHFSSMFTNDGQEDPDNIWYTGPFFVSPLGEAFTGSVTLESDPASEAYPYSGEVRFVNLRLLPAFPDVAPAVAPASQQ